MRALFVGRFQPFHHGHQEVVKNLLEKHEELIIVIGSAESEISRENPFTTGERIQMIRAAFKPDFLSRLIIVPVRDINDHGRWVSHVMSYVPGFEVVYSNNELVTELFSEKGIKAEQIRFIDRGENEGKLIRKQMEEGNPDWKRHVPQGVAQYLEGIAGPERLRAMSGK